jgi:DNA-binding transcriptional LysR family regulator
VPINLNQLRVFNAICDELTMTGAARRLHISQPGVSKQLAELEQSLGTVLVDRLPRGLKLTAAGEVLSRHAVSRARAG